MSTTDSVLACPVCGYTERFVAILEDCVSLVDASGTHIRMLEASVEFYRCWACGEQIPDGPTPDERARTEGGRP